MKNIDFSIVLYHDGVNKITFFTGLDILMLLFWLTVILIIASYIKSQNNHKEHYQFFMRNIHFKIGFSLVFAFYYIFFIQGGDTIAFYDCSRVLTNLLFKYPEYYLQEWPTYSLQEGYVTHFTPETGFPPGWIAREPEGYFVSKLFSIINIFTGSSYLATTVLSAFITSLASFKLYDFIVSFGIHDHKKLALYFLFIPSLSFWCTGVSKDALIVICLYYLIPTIYNLVSGKAKLKLWNVLVILFLFWILLNIRSFMVAVIIVPFIFAFNVQLAKRYFSSKFIRSLIRSIVIIIGFLFIGFYFSGETAQKYLREAEVTQQDFKTNKTYTGAKYDLGEVTFTPSGLLRALPISIFTGIYRPFPWEALSPGLLLNGIECLLLIYLSFGFVFNKGGKRIARIRNSDILTYSLYFVIIFAFMTGFTSVIFGILVRLRAPLLPFFLLLLTIKPQEDIVAPEEETVDSAVAN
ncbi:MAG: hypothetical protein K9G36_03500 [Crocinitomicaceae bacterium]|nr:hypothetical protein [Crocinitomicaceae bacterium]MCF8409976.1 hypothetical protein [Crocinitomicaceae bacterium]MCF8443775.1 hypothetical protein [Crocinitomicaceae bacterium]